ncbi:excalibur calcium-binding domain-containing protein [Glycomyces sp. NPDC049804]|uniref:excalibur calcium-binding domain-containing protein n=1 Tax=Glycomyces sp. NPDC049804 TaxID=3154363 RepID=UPI003444CD3C
MTLVLGVIATSPAGGERTQEREITHDFELVDFQPLDEEAMMEESDDDTSGETSMEDTDEQSDAETDPNFEYENCEAARDAGAAPVLEGQHGFGEHLDADNDGVGCENWSGTAQDSEGQGQAPQDSQYDNCTEARADGATDIPATDDRYAEHLDGDSDGTACESQ